jgi:hypothetical protein
MPDLVRLYIRHVLIGFALGLTFTGLLLWLNIGNLRHLVRATEGGGIAVLMLVVFNTIVFAGAQFAIAVMGLAEKGEPPGAGPSDAVAADPRPALAASGGNRSNRAGVYFPRA